MGLGLSWFEKVTKHPWLQPVPAGGAITEARFNSLAAGRARAAIGSRSLAPEIPGLRSEASAALTLQERGSFFYREQGDKKERDVMIHPFQACLIQAARPAHSGGVIQGHGLGLQSADEEEHGRLPYGHKKEMARNGQSMGPGYSIAEIHGNQG